jgi:26S proteasome regulatory subunit N12
LRPRCQQVALTAFASLPPLLEPSPTAAAELALARARPVAAARSPKAAAHALDLRAPGDVFEQAVLLSVKARDDAAFERNFAQLKPYYTDARCVSPRCRCFNPAFAPFALLQP